MEHNITYRKKDKGWQYIITVKRDGKWKHGGSKQGFATRGAAKIVAEEHVEKLKEKEEVQSVALPEYVGISVKELADMYTKHKTLHRAANTVDMFDRAIKHFKDILDMTPEDVRLLHIQNCVDGMVRNGLSLSTIKVYLSCVNTFFKFIATTYKVIKDNPVKTEDLILPTRKKEKKEKIKALNIKEFENLLSKIKNPKYYIASLLAATCGLRLGEILGLTWDRIDEENLTVKIDRQWKLLNVDGVRKYGFGSTKSETSERTVDLSPNTLAELLKFKRQHPRHISGRILPFAASASIAPNLIKQYHKLGYDISIHDLRHTYATTLIAKGLDFKTVAEYMGHDVEETIRTYSHVTDDMRNNARAIIRSIF